MQDSISKFIDHARQKGMDHATIFLLLRSSGWKEKEVAQAIAERELGAPIPERAGIGSARDAFLHLVAFTALYASAVSLIFLLFTYIEFAFPDAAMPKPTYAVEWALSGLRASMATLIVSYPVFLLTWWYLLREIRIAPEMAKSGVRRWLTSMTLFVGAATIMADVITVVFYLVEGDLTVRFLLKVFALLVITGALFIYLAITLRAEGQAGR